MKTKWQIEIKEEAFEDLENFPISVQETIIKYLEEYVMEAPDPLKIAEKKTGSLGELWAFRKGTSVGEVRIFFYLDINTIRVLHVYRRDIAYAKKTQNILLTTLGRYKKSSRVT
jgi:mRNA-degrading endonuclease RelE of RelBE toxin-antitoxin system